MAFEIANFLDRIVPTNQSTAVARHTQHAGVRPHQACNRKFMVLPTPPTQRRDIESNNIANKFKAHNLQKFYAVVDSQIIVAWHLWQH